MRMSAAYGLSSIVLISWFVIVSTQPAWDRPMWPGWKPDGAESTKIGTISTPMITTEIITEVTPRKEVTECTSVKSTWIMTTSTVASVVNDSQNAGLMLGVVLGVSLSLLLICFLFSLCYYFRKNFKLRVNDVQFQVGLDRIHLPMDDVVSCGILDEDEPIEMIEELAEDILVHVNVHSYGTGSDTYKLTCPGEAVRVGKVKEM